MSTQLGTQGKKASEVLEELGKQDWFKGLEGAEKAEIKTQTSALVNNLVIHGQSRLEIGRALTQIQEVLEPHGLFIQFLNSFRFHFSLKTAYRWMNGWKNAQKHLPPLVLQEALSTGMDIIGEDENKPFGVYTAAAQVIPFPKRITPQSARGWLEEVGDRAREMRKPVQGAAARMATTDGPVIARHKASEEEIRGLYIAFRRVLRKLGTDGQMDLLTRIVGMAVREFKLRLPGIKGVEVPEEWVRGRGRPKVA